MNILHLDHPSTIHKSYVSPYDFIVSSPCRLHWSLPGSHHPPGRFSHSWGRRMQSWIEAGDANVGDHVDMLAMSYIYIYRYTYIYILIIHYNNYHFYSKTWGYFGSSIWYIYILICIYIYMSYVYIYIHTYYMYSRYWDQLLNYNIPNTMHPNTSWEGT